MIHAGKMFKEYGNAEFTPQCLGTTQAKTYLRFLMWRDGFNNTMPYNVERTAGGWLVTQDRSLVLHERPHTGISFNDWASSNGIAINSAMEAQALEVQP